MTRDRPKYRDEIATASSTTLRFIFFHTAFITALLVPRSYPLPLRGIHFVFVLQKTH